MIDFKIRGMRFFQNDDGRNPFTTLAVADINLPDMDTNICGVRLTWGKKKGYVAMAPFVKGKTQPIQWFHDGSFARAVADRLRVMYEAMGGDLPDAKPEPRRVWIGAPADYVPDVSADDAAETAPSRPSVAGWPGRCGASAYDRAVERMREEKEGEPDNTGLHRFLGIEAEEVSRACD